MKKSGKKSETTPKRKPGRPRGEVQRRTITFRVSDAEYDRIASAATACDTPARTFVRVAALKEAGRVLSHAQSVQQTPDDQPANGAETGRKQRGNET